MNYARIHGWIQRCGSVRAIKRGNMSPLKSLYKPDLRPLIGLICLLFLLLVLGSTVGMSHAAGIPWSNNQAAEFSIGTGLNGSDNSGFSNPYGVAIDATHLKLYVADLNNNRVLRFVYPLTAGATAEAVFGQSDFTGTSANRGGSVANNTLKTPSGLALTANGDLWISDQGNHRVVKIASAYNAVNGAAASVVLGQSNFTSNSPGTSDTVMQNPASLSIDTDGNLWVADTGNSRILRFAAVASKTNGAAADGVLGQADFTSYGTNRWGSAAASTLSAPYGVSTSGTTLWVADYNNSRVLRFANAAGKANGANADGVLGQADFISVSSNRGGSIASNTLNAPGGVAVDAAGTLYVADSINYRILIFSDAASKANGAAADNHLATSSFTTSGNLASWALTYDDTYHRLVVANTSSSFVNQYFNRYTTTTTIASSQNPSKISGASVTFTATVTTADGGPMASGTVNFKEDGTILGSGTLNDSGVATFTTSSLTDGNHNIVAEYLSSASHQGSSSSALAQVIGPLTPFTLTAIANSERDNANGVDTFINGSTYGNTIYVGGYGSTGSSFYMTPALKFDLSSVTGAVVSATLKMRVFDKSDPSTLSVDLYGSPDDSWSDTTTPPTMPLSKVTPAITAFTPTAVAVGDMISLDVTAFVQAQYSGDKVASFVLESGINPETTDYVAFFSREAGAGYAPILDIRTSTAPTVIAVSPTSGPTSGNTLVVITGTNLTGATAVKFGSTNATAFTINSATQITATSPAGSAGTVDITIITAGGTSVTSTLDHFTYMAPSTVTFNSNGGSAVTSQNVVYNTTAAAPADPTKNGYTFAGWYSDSGLTTAFNFATPIIADITLYAKWTINGYILDITIAGGNNSKVESTSPDQNINCIKGTSGGCSASYSFGTTVTLTATGSNSSFSSWSGDYVSISNPGSITMTGDKAVTATFTPDPAKVKIDGSETSYYSINTALAAPAQDATVRAKDSSFSENVIMENSHTLTFKGGYSDNGFTNQTGYSSISGTLTVKAGKLIVDRVVVGP